MRLGILERPLGRLGILADLRNKFFSHSHFTASHNDHGRHPSAPPSDLSDTRSHAHSNARHIHTGFARAGSVRPIRSRSGAGQEHPRALRRVVRPDYLFARLHLVHWQSEHEPGGPSEGNSRIRKRIENSGRHFGLCTPT